MPTVNSLGLSLVAVYTSHIQFFCSGAVLLAIDSIVISILRHLRGKNIKIAPSLRPTSVLLNLFLKGVGPALRGLFFKPFLRQSSGLFFLGKDCKLINCGLLSVGKNVYLGRNGYFDFLSAAGVTFGNNVTIREFAWLQLTSHYDQPGESITIGNNVYIGPRVILGAAAPLRIGSRCQIGANVSFIAENHNLDVEGEIFESGVTRNGITVEDDVWIGNNVVILDGVTVGSGSVLGAGTVLTRSVPPRSIVTGVPGRVMRTR